MNTEQLIMEMTAFYQGDPKRIQHFIKVHSFARLIGMKEKISEETQFILETAAIVHDIGIKASEEKYGSSGGKYQELEGPPAAETLLAGLGYQKEVIERVCYLVGHHHTYHGIDGLDYQILVEADFLVNMYEDQMNADSIRSALNKIFRTGTGKWLCRTMFDTGKSL
ncbi:HD domain-containing protein [Lacrimispora indolis]|uniref:HD domain-containing protein n=1 Tax=Lacrimispora indolis TaxID=69825 RepID=UPI000400BB7A|nr:HD domain-containing protein [[Clostridium] methoxybenzovorans]